MIHYHYAIINPSNTTHKKTTPTKIVVIGTWVSFFGVDSFEGCKSEKVWHGHNDGARPCRYTWSGNKLGVIECNILHQIQPANTLEHQDMYICRFMGGGSWVVHHHRFGELHSPLEIPLRCSRTDLQVSLRGCPLVQRSPQPTGAFRWLRRHSPSLWWERCIMADHGSKSPASDAENGAGSNCWSRLLLLWLVGGLEYFYFSIYRE